MAQNKLLFYVVLLVFCSSTSIAFAGNNFEFKKDDLEFAEDLAKRSRQITMPQIKEKWYELQQMLGSNSGKGSISKESMGGPDDLASNISFRIFVSSSMSMNLLKAYAKEANKYNAVLVLRGLPDGSWHKLSDLVSEISRDNKESIAMQIDDEAFARFNITNVPAFVLAKEEDIFSDNSKVSFDKVTGSIGIGRVLEIFANSGQLADIAHSKLEGLLHE